MAKTGLTYRSKGKKPSGSTGGKYTNTKTGSGGGGGNGGAGGAGGSGGSGGSGGGGGWEPKKSDDRPQVEALRMMLGVNSKNRDIGKIGKGKNRREHMGTFQKALQAKLKDVKQILAQQDKIVLSNYKTAASDLGKSRADNVKAAAGGSFANLANRARERGDLLAQATVQGAGESDVLRTGLMALRNWAANQAEVNQGFYDTNRSINANITELNAKTRSSRADMYNQANADRAKLYSDYFNQRTDAWTQLGNIQANPNSNAYKKGSDAFKRAAQTTGKTWDNPGIPKSVQDWKGTIGQSEARMNNAPQTPKDEMAPKRPEGATLRKW